MRFNIKGELFASTFAYGLSTLIKLGSSLVLTRLLNPEAYGVIGILFSVAFTLELLSDVGAAGLLIRNPRGKEARFIHTLWTIRLVRCIVNFALLYTAAPIIAKLYGMPLLTDALRLFAFWFPLVGLESMAFIIAQRDQRARVSNYVDLASSAVMTLFVIGLASYIGDYTVFIYGALLQRLLILIASHFFYRRIGVGFAFDREAARDQFNFAKFVLPSSLLTIVLSQYDKIVFLKLFGLPLLGVYGLAGNMISPVANLIGHNCRVVLYPRCAAYFRDSKEIAGYRFYSENSRLFMVVTLPPVIIAGFSQSLVALLYDSRYHGAGIVLMAMGLNSLLGALQSTSENLVVAAGHTRVVLGGNIARLLTIAPSTLTGYFFFGFIGFVWFGLIANLIVLGYYYREQRKFGLLNLRSEMGRFSSGIIVFLVCLSASTLLLPHIPSDFVRQVFHLHSHEVH